MGSGFILLPLPPNLNIHFRREKQILQGHPSFTFDYSMSLEN